jgi:DNA-binding IclR family transcriptional regulator
VTRALAILDLIANSDQPVTLSQISKQLGVPKSSALGFLKSLVGAEFAAVNDHGEYTLGVHSFEIGAAYLRAMTPLRAAEDQLQGLTDTLGVTSHFAVLDGDEVVYLAKHDPPGLGFRLASALGARLPANMTAVGKAQLAHMPANGTVRANGAARSRAQLSDELDEVRAVGYAIDEGLTAVGIRCVASPVFDATGCCGAIGVSYPMDQGADWQEVAEAVIAAAKRASSQLGHRPATPARGDRDGF